MTSAKFGIGDRVSFVPGKYDNNVTRGVYTVVRTMPATNQGYQYRVKSLHDSHERVIDEAQLASAS
jgi:hypothetical protein